MSERLPRAPRSIAAIEPSRDLVEKDLRLVVAAVQNASEVSLVRAVFRQLARAADGKLDELRRQPVCGGLELVKRTLAFPPGLEQTRLLQQSQVRRDARLSHPRDLLQFVHGQFLALQQRHDAQAGRVGQCPQ